MPTNNNHPTVPFSSNLPMSTPKLTKFDLEEVLNKIENIRQTGFGPEPTTMETILSSGARERRRAIEEAKISAIKVRKDLIDSLSGAIAVYVDTHKADLKVRGSAFVATTFAKLTSLLNQSSEDAINSFYITFSKSIDTYETIPHLTEEMKTELGQQAWERAQQRDTKHHESFDNILSNIANQVEKLSNEIGER